MVKCEITTAHHLENIKNKKERKKTSISLMHHNITVCSKLQNKVAVKRSREILDFF